MDNIWNFLDNNWTIGAASLAGFLTWRGVPLTKRSIGQPAKIGKFAHIDHEWPNRNDKIGEGLDLTHVPVRRTARKLTSDESKEEENLVETVDVLIVGGAAAGLSAAACCKKEGLNAVVIEKNESSGDIWRSRYHRLHLHDIIDECHLPYFSMPDSYPVYPDRQQFASYLDAYRIALDLRVEYLHVVKSATRCGPLDGECEGWDVEVSDLRYENEKIRKFRCAHLVLANGIYNDPIIPEVPGIPDFKGVITHSSRYTNAEDLDLVGKKVLVVGWGNSGCEIIVDLVEQGAQPTVLIRSPQVLLPRGTIQSFQSFIYTHLRYLVKIPFGWVPLIPMVVLVDPLMKLITRIRYGYIERYGVKIHWKGILTRLITDGAPPVMDIGTISAIQNGKCKVVNENLKAITENGVQFEDGSSQEYDGIVFATGYERFSGHKHFLDEKSLEQAGYGVQATRSGVTPGAEIKRLKGLWILFGRLQMIRDAAPSLGHSIAVKMGKKKDSNKWIGWILKHIVFAVVVRYIYKRYTE